MSQLCEKRFADRQTIGRIGSDWPISIGHHRRHTSLCALALSPAGRVLTVLVVGGGCCLGAGRRAMCERDSAAAGAYLHHASCVRTVGTTCTQRAQPRAKPHARPLRRPRSQPFPKSPLELEYGCSTPPPKPPGVSSQLQATGTHRSARSCRQPVAVGRRCRPLTLPASSRSSAMVAVKSEVLVPEQGAGKAGAEGRGRRGGGVEGGGGEWGRSRCLCTERAAKAPQPAAHSNAPTPLRGAPARQRSRELLGPEEERALSLEPKSMEGGGPLLGCWGTRAWRGGGWHRL